MYCRLILLNEGIDKFVGKSKFKLLNGGNAFESSSCCCVMPGEFLDLLFVEGGGVVLRCRLELPWCC